MNGRINLTQQIPTTVSGSAPAAQFAHTTQFQTNAAADMVKGNLEKNPLNTAFFSNENLQIIQNKIQFEVYNKSQGIHRIGPQSAENLLIIMRSIYYQYGKNLPYQIKEQIAELNQKVADYAVPKIIGEIEMYRKYQNDIQNLPLPMSHPVNISRSGTKSNPMPPLGF